MKLRRMKLRRTKKCASFWATLYTRVGVAHLVYIRI